LLLAAEYKGLLLLEEFGELELTIPDTPLVIAWWKVIAKKCRSQILAAVRESIFHAMKYL